MHRALLASHRLLGCLRPGPPAKGCGDAGSVEDVFGALPLWLAAMSMVIVWTAVTIVFIGVVVGPIVRLARYVPPPRARP